MNGALERILAAHRPELNDAWDCISETCAADHEEWPCETAVLAEKIEAVVAIHQKTRHEGLDWYYCSADNRDWPCATVRVLGVRG